MRVLVVENNLAVASLFQEALQSEGISCARAASIGDADRFLAFGAADFDVLLVDDYLPDGSGFDWILETLPGLPHFAGRVVATTAYVQEGHLEALRDLGILLLVKPFDLSELTRAVRGGVRTAAP